MGEHGVVVVPVALRGRQAGEVDLAGRHDGVLGLAADLVAVDVEHRRERVEAADLLELLEALRDQRGVHQPDAGHGVGVVAELSCGGRGLRRVLVHLRVGQLERAAGRVDVAADERALAVRLVGADLELLDDRRPEPAEQHGSEDEDGEAEPGEQPGAPEDVGEEQHRADQGDQHEDRPAGENRVLARVGHAGEREARDAVVLEHEAVPVQPVAERLEPAEDAEQDPELDVGGGGGALSTCPEPHAAVHHVGDECPDDREDHHDEREAEDEAQPRIGEDVEAGVLAELGVDGAERRPVAPGQVGLPPRHRRGAGEQGDDDRRDDQHQPAVGVHGLAIALDDVVGPARHRHHAEPPRDPAGTAHHEHRHRREHDEEQYPGDDRGREHLAGRERVEPQLRRPDRRQREERDDEARDDDQGGNERPSSSGSASPDRDRGGGVAHRDSSFRRVMSDRRWPR